MRIYRVENDDGEGPYQGSYFQSAFLEGHNTFDHPDPWSDGMEGFTSEHFFGFDSLEKARDWFLSAGSYGDVVDWLEGNGYSLVAYDVDKDVRIGNKQIAFRKDYARLLERMPVREVFLT